VSQNSLIIFEKYWNKSHSLLFQLMTAYKELEHDKEKLKNTLTVTQDKSLRRISELKEQVELDQLAKQDLEQNYRLMLEEKDELVRVLQTQVRALDHCSTRGVCHFQCARGKVYLTPLH
jgi:hypothetical protein